MKLVLLFDHFGPYHQARLRAATAEMEAVGVEFHGRSHDYAWDVDTTRVPAIETVQTAAANTGRRNDVDLQRALEAKLDMLRPDVAAIPGWSSFGSLAALRWCLRRGVPAVLMSESSSHDERRRIWKEWIKRRMVRLFTSGLVGGSAHQRYLVQLGMPSDRIFSGYDSVDNAHFQGGKSRSLAAGEMTPNIATRPAFLASARFIEKKNLSGLLRAYARYRTLASAVSDAKCWPLILLGDGPLRKDLEALVRELGLVDCVEMPGFKQYDELPSHYACASAFVHPSTAEQWGLVVNEAMASGLPVLVSNRCGCAPDLVAEGVNGFTFDPANLEQLAQLMLRMAGMEQGARRALGDASRKSISDWGPKRFALGLHEAASSALQTGSRPPPALDKLILAMLMRR